MLPISAIVAVLAAISVNAQPNVILSDCIGTNINLANPGNRQLITNMGFNPQFNLDFTRNAADSYRPVITMPSHTVSVVLGPQMDTQPLSFVSLDKEINWLAGTTQFAITRETATPASGSPAGANTTTTVTSSIPDNTILDGQAAQGAFESFFRNAFESAASPYNIQGTTGARISAAAPSSFQFCFNNLTVPVSANSFSGWSGLTGTSMTTPTFNPNPTPAVRNNGFGLTHSITVPSTSTVDINIGTWNLNFLYTHDAGINLPSGAGGANAGTTLLGTVEVPDFRLRRSGDGANTFNAVLSLQPSDTNRYAMSHFLTRYVNRFGSSINGGTTSLAGNVVGNELNIPSLRPAFTNLTLPVSFNNPSTTFDFVEQNTQIFLRYMDPPNNNALLRLTIRNPFASQISVRAIEGITLESLLDLPDGFNRTFSESAVTFTPDQTYVLAPGQSQVITLLYNFVIERDDITAQLMFGPPTTPGIIRTNFQISFLGTNQPLYVKYDREVIFTPNFDLESELRAPVDLPSPTTNPETPAPPVTQTETAPGTSATLDPTAAP